VSRSRLRYGRGALIRSDCSAAVSGGFPFADFLEAPALLGGCGAVPAGSAAFQAFGDLGAVFLRVVVVVLELGSDARDVEAQTADSWEHPAIGGMSTPTWEWSPRGWKCASWRRKSSALRWGSSTISAWQVSWTAE
jgi:hypothetical protein